MSKLIVQESILREATHEIQNAVAGLREGISDGVGDPDNGFALTYHLFFFHVPSAGAILGIELSPVAQFHNAYYWFQRFANLRTCKGGYDAGLEQQGFKMLEAANFELDLEVIQRIDELAKVH